MYNKKKQFLSIRLFQILNGDLFQILYATYSIADRVILPNCIGFFKLRVQMVRRYSIIFITLELLILS